MKFPSLSWSRFSGTQDIERGLSVDSLAQLRSEGCHVAAISGYTAVNRQVRAKALPKHRKH